MMEALTSPVVLSSALLLAALLAYREAWTPPTAAADDSIRVDAGIKRIFADHWSRMLSGISKYVVFTHLLVEIYGLWAKSGQAPLNLSAAGINNICPLGGSATVKSIYPNQQLPPSALLSLGLIIFGGITRASCHRRLGSMFTWEASILKTHKLITSGPYQFVRHPSYTGLASVALGYTCFLWTEGTVARECFIGSAFPPAFNSNSAFGIIYALYIMTHYIDVVVFLFRRSFVEDKMLKKEFGKDWDEWARNVPYNVIPYIL